MVRCCQAGGLTTSTLVPFRGFRGSSASEVPQHRNADKARLSFLTSREEPFRPVEAHDAREGAGLSLKSPLWQGGPHYRLNGPRQHEDFNACHKIVTCKYETERADHLGLYPIWAYTEPCGTAHALCHANHITDLVETVPPTPSVRASVWALHSAAQ